MFDLSQGSVFFFRDEKQIPLTGSNAKSKLVLSQSISSTSIKTTGNDEKIDINIFEGGNPNAVLNNKNPKQGGFWKLSVQHSAGSLNQFVNNTRRKNLAISFGILSLLAVSTILIFISAHRAKSLAQKQMEFVSSVSHEFRTPVSVVYSAGENLSDGLVKERRKVESYGELLKREGKKLSEMVEQILDFAGANSGKQKYDFRETDISVVLKKAIKECEIVIKAENFTIEEEIPKYLPKITGDEKALTLAFQNLINNSLKYSNGTKWLKITAENGNGELKIAVEDKGIGISSKDKRHIFEPFYRSKKVVDEQISGNGLGLSLVEKIVKAHKGKININSEINKGSKFTVHLPVNN